MQMSMGAVKTCADNASSEGFFGQFKRELVYRCRMTTKAEAKAVIDDYVLNLFNPLCRKRMEKEELKRVAELVEMHELP